MTQSWELFTNILFPILPGTVEFTSLLLPVSHGLLTCLSPWNMSRSDTCHLQAEALRANVCFTMYAFPFHGECGHKGQDGRELLDDPCWSCVVWGRNKPSFVVSHWHGGLVVKCSITSPILPSPNIKWLLLSHFNHLDITGSDGPSTRGLQKTPRNSTNIKLLLLPYPFRRQRHRVLS